MGSESANGFVQLPVRRFAKAEIQSRTRRADNPEDDVPPEASCLRLGSASSAAATSLQGVRDPDLVVLEQPRARAPQPHPSQDADTPHQDLLTPVQSPVLKSRTREFQPSPELLRCGGVPEMTAQVQETSTRGSALLSMSQDGERDSNKADVSGRFAQPAQSNLLRDAAPSPVGGVALPSQHSSFRGSDSMRLSAELQRISLTSHPASVHAPDSMRSSRELFSGAVAHAQSCHKYGDSGIRRMFDFGQEEIASTLVPGLNVGVRNQAQPHFEQNTGTVSILQDENASLRQLVGMQQTQLLNMQRQIEDLHTLVAGMAGNTFGQQAQANYGRSPACQLLPSSPSVAFGGRAASSSASAIAGRHDAAVNVGESLARYHVRGHHPADEHSCNPSGKAKFCDAAVNTGADERDHAAEVEHTPQAPLMPPETKLLSRHHRLATVPAVGIPSDRSPHSQIQRQHAETGHEAMDILGTFTTPELRVQTMQSSLPHTGSSFEDRSSAAAMCLDGSACCSKLPLLKGVPLSEEASNALPSTTAGSVRSSFEKVLTP